MIRPRFATLGMTQGFQRVRSLCLYGTNRFLCPRPTDITALCRALGKSTQSSCRVLSHKVAAITVPHCHTLHHMAHMAFPGDLCRLPVRLYPPWSWDRVPSWEVTTMTPGPVHSSRHITEDF